MSDREPLGALTGSRASAEPVARLGPSGFDPARWLPIELAPKDGTPILVAVAGWHPHYTVSRGQFVTVARWRWSPEARTPHEDYPDDGGFLELNNEWNDRWGGNIGGRYWMPLPEPPEQSA